MATTTLCTREHEDIRQWVEAREGKPGIVRDTEDERLAALEIEFPGHSGDDGIEEITWEEFFRHFDNENLVFVYKDDTTSGEKSNFFKIVDEDKVDHFD